MKRQRLENLHALSKYRSSLMDIAIIWIVLFHSNIGAPDNTIFRVLWYLFVSFGGGIGVDIFFLLSGFGLLYSVQNGKEMSINSWMAWIAKRFKRILPSYLIVAILFYALKGNLSLYNLCQLNFLVDGIRDFWFIPAIIICYLFFPLFYFGSKRIGFRNMGLIAIILIQGIAYIIDYFNPIYYERIEIFLLRVPCFIIGTYWGYLSVNNKSKEYNIGIILSVMLCPICMCFPFVGSSRWCFLFATVVFIQLLVLLLPYVGGILRVVFDYLGKRSLQVYLTHVSLGLMLSNLLSNTALSITVYFISAIVMGELLYHLIALINRKIIV